MKIAYFSPFPPKQTGIAAYSVALVEGLRKLMAVDCYDFRNREAQDPSNSCGDFEQIGRVSHLRIYDAVIYHLGNNPHFHLDIFHMLRQFPGIVVLHDVVLYYLFAGLGRSGLIKHLWLNYGMERASDIDLIIADAAEGDILRYKHPENYPLVASIFSGASSIVVHNRWAHDRLVALGYERSVHVVPLLASTPAQPVPSGGAVYEFREKHGIGKGELVIACLGFIGPTKRIEQVAQALSRLKGKLAFRFLVVGQGDDLTHLIETAGLTECTIRTYFVSDVDFSRYLALTDIVVNLRFPSMGESSATLTKAMSMGKACIITNDASFSEIPDDCAIKIGIGASEVNDLAQAIERLVTDWTLRDTVGNAAKAFVNAHLRGDTVAGLFKNVIERDILDRAQGNLIAAAKDVCNVRVPAEFLRQSLDRCLPPHLRVAIEAAVQ
jgi:glycosyltransferase involved in cell wall biosynthesis